MATVAVIDYGMGNIHSISKALKVASPSYNVVVSDDADVILAADHIVFPGVGAIRDCMNAIRSSGVDAVVKKAAEANKPILGICIGMQALMDHSEENNGVECLGLLPGNVVKFSHDAVDTHGNKLKIPHMGWSMVHSIAENPLFKEIKNGERFYFVHSYFVTPSLKNQIIAESEYPETFACALQHKNIVAVQFHPEKSQHAGIQLLKNFLNWDGST